MDSKIITIGFSKPKKFKIGAQAIKLWQQSEYSHVVFIWQDDQGRDLVVHAAHGNVHFMLLSNFIKENDLVEFYNINFTNEEYNKLRDFCYQRLGTTYAYLDLLHIAIYDIFMNLGIKIIPENSNGYICSELVSSGLQYSKDLELPKPTHLMTPKDVKLLVKKEVLNG